MGSNCWKDCTAVLGACGGTCKLQPAVSLKDFLFSGEALDGDPHSELTERLGKENEYPPSQVHRLRPRGTLAVEFRGTA